MNDFDEAAVAPFPFDLVRLAASARLAPERSLGSSKTARLMVEGYGEALRAPRPILLDEQETWMREYFGCADAERRQFWRAVDDYATVAPPVDTVRVLVGSLPEMAGTLRLARRVASAGSLGRPRFVAIARWRGGRVVREAKALVPSAWGWAHDAGAASQAMDLAEGAYRAPDPRLHVMDKLILRRLAADARKVELGPQAGAKLHGRVVRAMGFDLGAIHAVDAAAATRIDVWLDRAPKDWLREAARVAAADVTADFHAWRAAPSP